MRDTSKQLLLSILSFPIKCDLIYKTQKRFGTKLLRGLLDPTIWTAIQDR